MESFAWLFVYGGDLAQLFVNLFYFGMFFSSSEVLLIFSEEISFGTCILSKDNIPSKWDNNIIAFEMIFL